MKNVFTRALILDTALVRHQRVREAIYIMLALTLMGLGIAGFLTLFKQIMLRNTEESLSSPELTRSPNRSLLSFAFPTLQLSCSPIIEHHNSLNSGVLWNGICRPLNINSQRTFQLTLTANNRSKKFHGFKLAKEVLYVFNKNGFESLGSGEFTASGISAYALGGATYLKVKSIKKNVDLNILGIGLGFGVLVDKKMRLEFNEITQNLAAKI